MNVGVLGYGYVGKATAQLSSVANVSVHDPYVKDVQDEEAAYTSDLVIACVPTPQARSGSIDLSTMSLCVAKWLKYGAQGVFVIKSTVPCGTTDSYIERFNVPNIIHNPEFLTESSYLQDFANPTDVVIGGEGVHVSPLKSLYEKFYAGKDVNIRTCSAKEAELVKIVRNSFYATKVTFMNEVYFLCEKLDVDYQSFAKALTDEGSHPWWGPEHVRVPGNEGQFGYGGKCFPKDVSGLLSLARDVGVSLSVLNAAKTANAKLRKIND